MSAYAPSNVTQQQLQALWQQGRRLQDAGQLLEAAQVFQTLLNFAPDNWATHYNLGLVYQGLQLYSQARDVYRRTVELNPGLAQAHNNLGSVLWVMDEAEEALAAYRRATETDPGLAIAHYNCGLIEESLGQLTPCIESMLRTVELDPANDLAWEKAFSLMIGLKRRDEAFALFHRWENATPTSIKRMPAGMMVSRLTGDRQREQHYLAGLAEWKFPSYSPVDLIPILGNLQYYDVAGETILACYRRFDRAMKAQQKDVVPMLPRRSKGKIRIGYVSPDYRTHVMGRIMFEVMRAHDRDRFEIYLISLCDARYHDAMTGEFRKLADGFADISKLKDRQAAQAIAEVDLDILVDLAGHTMGARPGVYAHHPARHIVTHLGYHGCLGMETIEYKFTDRLADTAESVAYQIEKPYFLDTCLFPFSHVDPAPHKPSREELRRTLGVEDRFVFAAFVNPVKLSPRCLDAWKRVLDAVPAAVLAFSPYDPDDGALVLQLLATAGIGADRIVFISAAGDDAEQRARYRAIDGVLDTFPYAGGDTTLAALDMGIPVVTLKGARNAERTGHSILGHLGVSETVAASEDEFVALAIRLANDHAWRRALVARIDLARRNSPMASIPTHVAALEKAYIDIAAIDGQPASTMTAREFYQRYQEALRMHQGAKVTIDQERVAELYDQLHAEQPDHAPLRYARGMLAQDQGLMDAAESHFSAAVASSPGDVAARTALAKLLLDRNAHALAIDALSPAMGDDLRNAKLFTLAARAYLGVERWQDAATAAERAITLAPTDADAVFANAVALSHLSRAGEALTMFNRVLALDNRHAEAAYNAAILMGENGEFATAEVLFRRCIANAPANEIAYWRLSGQLIAQARIADLITVAASFSKACPGSLRGRFRAAQALRLAGNFDAGAAAMREIAGELLGREEFAEIEELLRALLQMAPGLDFPVGLLRQLARRSTEATAGLYAHAGTQTPGRSGKIRIGYVTENLHDDLVGRTLLAFLTLHDKSSFEVHAFMVAPMGARDSVTERCEAAAATVTTMHGWTGPRIVEAMRSADLDILVDVTGIGDEKMAFVWSQEPARARLQLPIRSGYGWRGGGSRLADRYTELPLTEDVFTSPPLFLERSVHAALGIAAQETAPVRTAASSRKSLQIPERAMVFAVCGDPDYLSTRGLGIWKSLLAGVPQCHLLVMLEWPTYEKSIRDALTAAGVSLARVSFASRYLADGSPMPLVPVVDGVLDSLPASNVSLVLAAANVGIPVVSLAGQLPGERLGAAILADLGMTEMIAGSGVEFVECARRLAEDPTLRKSIGERLKQATQTAMPAAAKAYVGEYERSLVELCALQSAGGSSQPA